jgi:hypothetical protein
MMKTICTSVAHQAGLRRPDHMTRMAIIAFRLTILQMLGNLAVLIRRF